MLNQTGLLTNPQVTDFKVVYMYSDTLHDYAPVMAVQKEVYM